MQEQSADEECLRNLLGQPERRDLEFKAARNNFPIARAREYCAAIAAAAENRSLRADPRAGNSRRHARYLAFFARL